MDVLNDILKVIITAVASLGGISLIKFLFFFKSERRLRNIETDEKELGVMKGLVESLKERIEQQDAKIRQLNERVDLLYEEKHKLERENNKLIQENAMLKIKISETEKYVCWRPKDQCFQRIVETDHCLYRKLIRGVKDQHPNAIVTEEDMKKKQSDINVYDEDNRISEKPDKSGQS